MSLRTNQSVGQILQIRRAKINAIDRRIIFFYKSISDIATVNIKPSLKQLEMLLLFFWDRFHVCTIEIMRPITPLHSKRNMSCYCYALSFESASMKKPLLTFHITVFRDNLKTD